MKKVLIVFLALTLISLVNAGELIKYSFENDLLDTGADSTVADNLTISSGAPVYGTGVVGATLYLENTEFCDTSDSIDLDPDSLTIEAFIRPVSFNSGWVYVAWRDDQTYMFGTYDGTVAVSVDNNGAYSFGGTPVTTGTWHHVATTIDSSTNTLKCYLDGVEVNTATYDGTLTDSIYRLVVGYLFEGYIDEFILHDDVKDITYMQARASMIPQPAQTTDPDPGAGYTSVDVSVSLKWSAPKSVDNPVYNVYLTSDPNTIDSLLIETTSETYTGSLSLLNDTEYFWRVDVVDDENVYTGELWSFSTIQDLTPQKLLEWKLDQATGIDVLDASGNSRDGEISGTTTWVDGLVANGLKIDDQGSYIQSDFGSGLPVLASDSWSINMYLYLYSHPGGFTIFGGFGDGLQNSSQRMIINYADGIYFWGSGSQDIATGVPFDVKKWQMITVTSDGITTRVFKNGQQIGSRQLALGDALDIATIALADGGFAGAWYNFSGIIDEFTIWDQPLSQLQINHLSAQLGLISDLNGDAVVDLDDMKYLAGQWLDDDFLPMSPDNSLEDFESYADQSGLESVWSIGSGFYPETGTSTVSLITDPAQVHGGSKALRWTYDNLVAGGAYSEFNTALTTPIDLTQYDEMHVWLNRHAGNSLEDILYVKFLSSFDQSGIEAEAWIEASNGSTRTPTGWTKWVIDLNNLTTGTKDNLNNVVGYFFGTWGQSGTGTIDFDDIVLVDTITDCGTNPPASDLNGDCVVNLEDFAMLAINWWLNVSN